MLVLGSFGKPSLKLTIFMAGRTEDRPQMAMPKPACTADWIEARLELE
jgi:hypothetical protein